VAPNHHTVIQALRDTPDFWKQLADTLDLCLRLLIRSADVSTDSKSEKGKEKEADPPRGSGTTTTKDPARARQMKAMEENAPNVCHQTMVAAFIMRILALEIYYVPAGDKAKLDAQLIEQLDELNARERQISWLKTVASYYYDLELKKKLMGRARELKLCLLSGDPSLSYHVRGTTSTKSVSGRGYLFGGYNPFMSTAAVAAARLGADSRDSGSVVLPTLDSALHLLLLREGERTYGENYVYDVELMQRKLYDLLIEESMDDDEDEVDERYGNKGKGKLPKPSTKGRPATRLIKTTKRMNLALSLLDVQFELLSAWKALIEVTSLRQPSLSIFLPSKAQAALALVKGLARVVGEECRTESDPIVDARVEEMADLFLFLLRNYLARVPARLSLRGKDRGEGAV
jgi:hypothetical protein